jgi:alcohol dehydrogenase (cytochrome c)
MDRYALVSAGNPGPDLVDTYRKGLNLYANSVVALDIAGARPKLRSYYKIVRDDTHDIDPAMPPVLFDATIGGVKHQLLALADKGGNFVTLDRRSGTVVYRFALDRNTGLTSTVPTLKGTLACPNHGGGVEWNGGAYDPATNVFFIPSTQECGIWKIVSTHPQYIPGQQYTGGPLPKRQVATGRLTAVDEGTGKVAWIHQFPYPTQGGVVITRSHLAAASTSQC